MPRQARKKSESGIYHIMFRGINRQQIFEDSEDNEKFLNVLHECKAISGYKVFAYCLMGNHLHLLLKFENETIEQSLKRICGRFVYWYNAKYGRVGHLFQDRFKSEPIEDDAYFLSCVRYIHQNPVKAGISAIEQYPYSSYIDYLLKKENGLTDIEFLFSMLDENSFVEFSQKEDKTEFVECEKEAPAKITDEKAKAIIFKVSKCKSVTEFQLLESSKKQKYLVLLKRKGLGIRQISRLTGESYYIVQKTD